MEEGGAKTVPGRRLPPMPALKKSWTMKYGSNFLGKLGLQKRPSLGKMIVREERRFTLGSRLDEALELKSLRRDEFEHVIGTWRPPGPRFWLRIRSYYDTDTEEWICPNMMIIHPQSHVSMGWSAMMIMAVFTLMMYFPFAEAFDYEPMFGRTYTQSFWVIALIIIDVYFFLDLFLNFCTAYLDDGELIQSHPAIAKHYLSGWFTIDFLSTFSAVLEHSSSPEMALFRNLKVLRLVRLLKLLRVAKLKKAFETIDSIIEEFRLVWSLLKLLFLISVVTHLFACMFYLIGTLSPDTGWLSAYFSETESSAALPVETRYLAALYWSFVTVTTVGYGDVLPKNDNERVWCVLTTFAGTAMFAYTTGEITALANQKHASMAVFSEKMKNVEEFMRYHRLPKRNRIEIRRFFDQGLQSGRFINEKQVLADLPRELRQQTMFILKQHLLERLPCFRPLVNTDTVRELTRGLVRIQMQEGKTIAKQNSECTEMYIVSRGELEAVSKQTTQPADELQKSNMNDTAPGNNVAAGDACQQDAIRELVPIIMNEGSHFGLFSEDTVIMRELQEVDGLDPEDFLYTVTIRTLTACEFYILPKRFLFRVLNGNIGLKNEVIRGFKESSALVHNALSRMPKTQSGKARWMRGLHRLQYDKSKIKRLREWEKSKRQNYAKWRYKQHSDSLTLIKTPVIGDRSIEGIDPSKSRLSSSINRSKSRLSLSRKSPEPPDVAIPDTSKNQSEQHNRSLQPLKGPSVSLRNNTLRKIHATSHPLSEEASSKHHQQQQTSSKEGGSLNKLGTPTKQRKQLQSWKGTPTKQFKRSLRIEMEAEGFHSRRRSLLTMHAMDEVDNVQKEEGSSNRVTFKTIDPDLEESKAKNGNENAKLVGQIDGLCSDSVQELDSEHQKQTIMSQQSSNKKQGQTHEIEGTLAREVQEQGVIVRRTAQRVDMLLELLKLMTKSHDKTVHGSENNAAKQGIEDGKLKGKLPTRTIIDVHDSPRNIISKLT